MVDVPRASVAHGALHRQHAALPGRLEWRVPLFDLDLAEAVHAAHVVNAVHHFAPGLSGSPVPIIESRVTRSASLSSLQPSVPAGGAGAGRGGGAAGGGRPPPPRLS